MLRACGRGTRAACRAPSSCPGCRRARALTAWEPPGSVPDRSGRSSAERSAPTAAPSGCAARIESGRGVLLRGGVALRRRVGGRLRAGIGRFGRGGRGVPVTGSVIGTARDRVDIPVVRLVGARTREEQEEADHHPDDDGDDHDRHGAQEPPRRRLGSLPGHSGHSRQSARLPVKRRPDPPRGAFRSRPRRGSARRAAPPCRPWSRRCRRPRRSRSSSTPSRTPCPRASRSPP